VARRERRVGGGVWMFITVHCSRGSTFWEVDVLRMSVVSPDDLVESIRRFDPNVRKVQDGWFQNQSRLGSVHTRERKVRTN